jgi:protein-L-isoaspartate(D-aspartate) O-methyltransferase
VNIEQARFNMIEQQIRPWDVLDARVLAILSAVKREDFVPLAHKALAFVDMAIPLRGPSEEALRLGQCMLAPRVEARLLQDVSVQAHERVLEIGTGSGYMAALLAQQAQRVISLEIAPDMAQLAQDNLVRAGVRNVEVRLADGAAAKLPEEPFDVIVLSGSVAHVPNSLLQQLKPGGRLIGIVGNEPVMCATLITRTDLAHWRTEELWDTVAPRLMHFPEDARFTF